MELVRDDVFDTGVTVVVRSGFFSTCVFGVVAVGTAAITGAAGAWVAMTTGSEVGTTVGGMEAGFGFSPPQLEAKAIVMTPTAIRCLLY